MGEIRDILTERITRRLGLIQCAMGTHPWVDYPAVVASQYPAINAAGDVVGSWIPSPVIVTRTSMVFSAVDPNRPVNTPTFHARFQPTSAERDAFTRCDRCGDRRP